MGATTVNPIDAAFGWLYAYRTRLMGITLVLPDTACEYSYSSSNVPGRALRSTFMPVRQRIHCDHLMIFIKESYEKRLTCVRVFG